MLWRGTINTCMFTRDRPLMEMIQMKTIERMALLVVRNESIQGQIGFRVTLQPDNNRLTAAQFRTNLARTLAKY